MKLAQENKGLRQTSPLGLMGVKTNRVHRKKCDNCLNVFEYNKDNKIKFSEFIFCSLSCKKNWLETHQNFVIKKKTITDLILYITENSYEYNSKLLYRKTRDELIKIALKILKGKERKEREKEGN